ncbi:MAG TPA: pantetheine-phosphate adenylyltransferase [Dehalococcoidales bacterium]|nr:pantetheine-phosphate adenylyltransferase [Dehalococcoidales bacterium]
MTNAVYAGTFDPITNGHVDVAKRAAKLFDKLYLAIYDSPAAVRPPSAGATSAGKGLFFTSAERLALAKEATSCIPNIEVYLFRGLVVDFARQVGSTTIVRGLRMVTDFEREFETAMMNKKLNPDLEVVCFMASLQYQFLSASIIKEVVSLGGDVSSMVPPNVARALKDRMAGKPLSL